MKAKSWLKYLVYSLLVIGAVYLEGYMEKVFQQDYNAKQKINFLFVAAFTLATVIIGVILGLEHLLNERKKEGIWKVNVPKVVLMVIPALYGALAYVFYFIAISNNNETIFNIFVSPTVKFFSGSTAFMTIFQVVLGYLIITSFYKGVKKEVITGEADFYPAEEATDIDGEADGTNEFEDMYYTENTEENGKIPTESEEGESNIPGKNNSEDNDLM